MTQQMSDEEKMSQDPFGEHFSHHPSSADFELADWMKQIIEKENIK